MKNKKKIAILGGGGGIVPIIEGLKFLYDISAIVSVFDDGGSTGQLRNHSGIAVGDLRNALAAMSKADEKIIRDVFSYRFSSGRECFYNSPKNIVEAALEEMNYDNYNIERIITELEERFDRNDYDFRKPMNLPITTNGHPVGNLILTFLIRNSQNDKWIDAANDIFGSLGKVLPNSLLPTVLVASFDGFSSVVGESYFDNPDLRIPPIKEINLKDEATAYSGAIEAIKNANIVVLAPGSFYTSLIACLLPKGFIDVLRDKEIIWYANFFYDLNQTLYRIPITNGEKIVLIKPEDQLNILEKYLGKKPDYLVAQDPSRFPTDPDILDRYKGELGIEDIMPVYPEKITYLTDLARLDYTQMKRGPGYVFRHDPQKVEQSFRDIVAKYNL